MSKAYLYQNGGDWTWFGGRMIQQLVVNGMVEEAYAEIHPMIERVIQNNGFYEWYGKGGILVVPETLKDRPECYLRRLNY